MAWWNDDWHFKVPLHHWLATNTSGDSAVHGIFVQLTAQDVPGAFESGDSGLMDVRFVHGSDQTELPAYRVYFDDSDLTGRGACWFVCNPFPYSDFEDSNYSQHLWAYYGNTGASDISTADAFKDAGYISVWFFDEAGPTATDLIGNTHLYAAGETLNAYATQMSHPIGLMCWEMSGASEYLWAPESTASALKEPHIYGMALSFNRIWGSRRACWVSKPAAAWPWQYGGWGMGCRPDNATYHEPPHFWFEQNGFNSNYSPMLVDTWHHALGRKGMAQGGSHWYQRNDIVDPLRELGFNAGPQGTSDSLGLYFGKIYDTTNWNHLLTGRFAWAGVYGGSQGLINIGWRNAAYLTMQSLNNNLFTVGDASGNSGYGIGGVTLRPDMNDLIEVVIFG
jgi:hypothetical protein